MFHKKIRIWHLHLKQMFKVAVINFETNTVEAYPFIGEKRNTSMVFNMSEVILSQASGLQDDKNFNVFEKDILNFEDTSCVLRYGDYGDNITKVNGFGWYLDSGLYHFPYLGGAEKIGNIFENPEIVIGDSYVR